MKTLYLMRHAKKDESNPNTYDYDIELSQEGLDEAKEMSKKLKELEITPDLIVSSPAIRARQTSDIVSNEINYSKAVMYNEVIYQAFLNELVESITYTYDTVDTLFIVGHNPSLTAFGISFCGLKEELNTTDVAKIEFNCNSWVDIDKSNATLINIFKV